MSQFVRIDKNKNYIYINDNKEYAISPYSLRFLFKTFGYCLDPKSNNLLPLDTIKNLKQLAVQNHDLLLLDTIEELKCCTVCNQDSCVIKELVKKEKERFYNQDIKERSKILLIMNKILQIGLYLGGWNNEEPYITSLKPPCDIIRLELKVNPLIQSLYKDPKFSFIKDLPIVSYYKENEIIKPMIDDCNLTLEKCLNFIKEGINEDCKVVSSRLISTSYFYVTDICSVSNSMLELLIHSIAKSK